MTTWRKFPTIGYFDRYFALGYEALRIKNEIFHLFEMERSEAE